MLFRSDRSFDVRVGSCLSDAYEQEMGVPQGSILSITLFIMKINSIIKCIPAGVRGSLYVDDFLICFRSKSVIAIERQLQRCINSRQTWADENGFQFSKSKTVCMHFSNQQSIHAEPDLKHILMKKGETTEPTNTFILTFSLPTPPKFVKAAHMRIPVDLCAQPSTVLQMSEIWTR